MIRKFEEELQDYHRDIDALYGRIVLWETYYPGIGYESTVKRELQIIRAINSASVAIACNDGQLRTFYIKEGKQRSQVLGQRRQDTNMDSTIYLLTEWEASQLCQEWAKEVLRNRMQKRVTALAYTLPYEVLEQMDTIINEHLSGTYETNS